MTINPENEIPDVKDLNWLALTQLAHDLNFACPKWFEWGIHINPLLKDEDAGEGAGNSLDYLDLRQGVNFSIICSNQGFIFKIEKTGGGDGTYCISPLRQTTRSDNFFERETNCYFGTMDLCVDVAVSYVDDCIKAAISNAL